MTEFQNKSFSVYPGKDGGAKYRDNWDRIFSKPRSALPMPSAANYVAEDGTPLVITTEAGSSAPKSDP